MLKPAELSQRLQADWLGQFPVSVTESADRFAGAFSLWFSTAMAAGFPCSTASARRGQLMAAATAALESGGADTSASLLALGVAGYIAGQLFGSGTATFPLAVPAAIVLISGCLADLDLDTPSRADRIAQACHGLVISTLVVFPPSLPPASIV